MVLKLLDNIIINRLDKRDCKSSVTVSIFPSTVINSFIYLFISLVDCLFCYFIIQHNKETIWTILSVYFIYCHYIQLYYILKNLNTLDLQRT